MKNLFRKKWFYRPLCTITMLCHLGVVSYVPYAFSATTQENVTSATNFYKTLPQVSATSNGTVQYGKGQAVDLNSAYPNQGSSTSLDSLKGTYGDDSNTLKAGQYNQRQSENRKFTARRSLPNAGGLNENYSKH